jgi:hypothetical protein
MGQLPNAVTNAQVSSTLMDGMGGIVKTVLNDAQQRDFEKG